MIIIYSLPHLPYTGILISAPIVLFPTQKFIKNAHAVKIL